MGTSRPSSSAIGLSRSTLRCCVKSNILKGPRSACTYENGEPTQRICRQNTVVFTLAVNWLLFCRGNGLAWYSITGDQINLTHGVSEQTSTLLRFVTQWLYTFLDMNLRSTSSL